MTHSMVLEVSDIDAVAWVSTVLLWILMAAGIVLLILLMRLVLAQIRAVHSRAEDAQPAAPEGAESRVAVSASFSRPWPDAREPMTVPPENPHAPTTPSTGVPRVPR